MLCNKLFELLYIVLVRYLLEAYHALVQSLVQGGILIEYVCNSSAHTSCEVLAGTSENDCRTSCHVLTSVIADTFYSLPPDRPLPK